MKWFIVLFLRTLASFETNWFNRRRANLTEASTMKIRIMLIISFVALAIGCAHDKTKDGRKIQVTKEDNVMSCRFIGDVSGDAMTKAAELNRATHLVYTGNDEGKVYSCD
jgi:hypothetical protein